MSRGCPALASQVVCKFSIDAFKPFETRRCTDELWAAAAGTRQRVPVRLAIETKNRSRVCIDQHSNAGSCFKSSGKVRITRRDLNLPTLDCHPRPQYARSRSILHTRAP